MFREAGNATLGEIIDYLHTLPRHMQVRAGFTNPHSYRGYYADLAFEPAEDVSVAHMLAEAERAVGETFCGYKGGKFTMTRYTYCWLAEYGNLGIPMVLPGVARLYVLPSREDTHAGE